MNKALYLRLNDDIHEAIERNKLAYETANDYVKRALFEKLERDENKKKEEA